MIRTLRKSFRRKKQPRVPESTRPHQWQKDEDEVRASKCNFHVKVKQSIYLLYMSPFSLFFILQDDLSQLLF